MCTTCGCGGGDAVVEGVAHAGHDHAGHDHAGHDHAGHDHAGHDHAGHDHAGHDHAHAGLDHAHAGHDPAALLPEKVVFRRRRAVKTLAVTPPADTHAARLIRVERDLLSHNAAIAVENRAVFTRDRTFALNLMSSPGAGKTTLLVATLLRLADMSVGVIEGDQATSLDAERIRAAGAPAVQVNTGAGCHLDAGMIARARVRLPSLVDGVLFIENVGNLVCPAAFDLGEARRVVIVSVTEGEDKPLKYPAMFASADLVVITKVDLLPHLDVNLALLVANLDRVSPGVRHLLVSARTSEGLEAWCAWIRAR